MLAHPTFETLLDLVENRLPEGMHRQVIAHVDSPCAVCQAEIEAISDILDLLTGGQLAELPPAAVRRAIRLFRHLHKQPTSDNRPRLIAYLIYDSRFVPGAVAARGVGQERQMLYSAEGLDIDLQVSDQSGKRTMQLIGQVMPTDDDPSKVQGCLVRLAQEEEVTAVATTDELGTFTFREVIPGDYELWLDLPHAQVWIPSLTVGPTGTV